MTVWEIGPELCIVGHLPVTYYLPYCFGILLLLNWIVKPEFSAN